MLLSGPLPLPMHSGDIKARILRDQVTRATPLITLTAANYLCIPSTGALGPRYQGIIVYTDIFGIQQLQKDSHYQMVFQA